MKARWTLAAVAATVAVLVTGCGSATGTGDAQGRLPRYQVGDETVYSAPFHSAAIAFDGLASLTAETPVIIVGRVSAANAIDREVIPADREEGVLAGEGADLYGAITFTVTSAVKGAASGNQLRLVYESGKRDGQKPSVRIAYQHEGLAVIQRPDGTLRTPAELADTTFVVLATPVRRPLVSAGHASDYELVHPHGMAVLDAGSVLDFGAKPPVRTRGVATTITLDELRAAVAKGA
jgi:hypothetical protein